MAKFRVKYNFSAYQPSWTGDYVRRFGKNNEGFVIDAKDEKDAKEKLKKEKNLNPFYLKIVKEGKNRVKITNEELSQIILEVVKEMIQEGDSNLIKLMMNNESSHGETETDINEWIEKTIGVINESLNYDPETELPEVITEERIELIRMQELAGIEEQD